MRIAVGCTIVLSLLLGCESPSAYETAPIEADYSHITDPFERWKAYGLESYTIEQSRSCECGAPWQYTVVVRQGEIVEVLYDLPEDDDIPRDDYDNVLRAAATVAELFGRIESVEATAARIEVTYHPRYGYPTDVYIDYDARTADEEFSRRSSNLTQLVD